MSLARSLSALLTVFLLQPIYTSTVLAQSDSEIRAFLEELILTKEEIDFHSFEVTTLEEVLAWECEPPASSYCTHQDLRDQLPFAIQDISPQQPIRVLHMIACDVFGGADFQLGIIPDGEVVRTSMIHQSRINIALRNAGINIRFSEREADSIGFNYSDSDPYISIRRVNDRLLQFYESGLVSEPLVVFDTSQCGDGDIEITFDIQDGMYNASIIEEGYFSLCSVRTNSPWDRGSCRWWKDLGYTVWIAGVYVWQGQMPDGSWVSGRIDVSNHADRTVRIPN